MKFKKQEGVAIVEMALILPLFLLLVFGMIEFSVALYDKAMITNASREGARAAIVYHNTDPITPEQVETVVNNYLADRLISFGGPTSADVTVTGSTATGSPRTVRVEYNYQFLVLPGFLTGSGSGINLAAETIMRME